jgi:quercetin dioxygenase-like cupin family protein
MSAFTANAAIETEGATPNSGFNPAIEGWRGAQDPSPAVLAAAAAPGTLLGMKLAQRVDPSAAETIEVLGPTVRILTPPTGDDGAPCLMRGTIPPGGRVPLHSHGDVETFIVLAGEVDGLSGPAWVRVGPGDVFHIPAHVPHAWRNRSREPAEMLIVSTERIARFFREVAGPPSDAALGLV